MPSDAEKLELRELQPRWIHTNIFVFLCPHCQNVWLSCKNAQMTYREQREIFEKEFGEDWNTQVVRTNPDSSWNIRGSTAGNGFEDITVTPSIDASASGHWHGFVTNGEIK